MDCRNGSVPFIDFNYFGNQRAHRQFDFDPQHKLTVVVGDPHIKIGGLGQIAPRGNFGFQFGGIKFAGLGCDFFLPENFSFKNNIFFIVGYPEMILIIEFPFKNPHVKNSTEWVLGKRQDRPVQFLFLMAQFFGVRADKKERPGGFRRVQNRPILRTGGEKNEEKIEKRFVGGLLGHWAVWTRKAVELLNEIKVCTANSYAGVEKLLTKGIEVTDMNAAIFDAKNNFKGCIPGIHEILRRQGLLQGRWCLNREEELSEGQMNEIERILKSYPHLTDDGFVKGFLEEEGV